MRGDQQAVADELLAYALALPGAHEDFPWGERVIKVGKKVFVFMAKLESVGLSYSLKLPQSGPEVLELPFAEPTGYGLGKSGWVTVRFEPRDHVPKADVARWIEESYRAVAPKRLVAELDASQEKRVEGKSTPRTLRS